MALFSSLNGARSYGWRPRPYPVVQRRMIVLQQAESLPASYRHLSVLCHSRAHALPCSTDFVEFTNSNSGSRVALYRCPLCATEYGYCRDFRTGAPRPLFVKPGPNGR